MKWWASALWVLPFFSYADDRKDILDAVRPVASQKASQSVKIKVDILNIDKNSAMLVGELRNSQGQALNWSQIGVCSADLDKMLWVVLDKKATWRVKHIEICSPEPPYWYLEDYGGFDKNCGIYKGIPMSDKVTLEQQCLNSKKK